jgi:hypothetical protein
MNVEIDDLMKTIILPGILRKARFEVRRKSKIY